MAVLGIDFGTSNTGAAIMDGAGRPEIIALEPGRETLPTAIFLDFAARRTLYGSAAVEAMIDGREGRFMRALKSVLGTPLARERRQFLNERLTLIEIIGRFLGEICSRAEAQAGQEFKRALSGRPVHFHSRSPERDAQALVDLREAYALAGFQDVEFLPEPEAAAWAAGGEGVGLIVDIGGGTSDFSVFEAEAGRVRIRASHGIRLGGTDFDRTLSLAHVMPLLGMGADLRKELGSGLHPAPRALFLDLASWEKIPFVYGPQAERDVHRWEKLAVEPRRFARLAELLEMHLGHDVAFAVEAGKIAANGDLPGGIDLGVVEHGLSVPLGAERMALDLAPAQDALREAAEHCITLAGIAPDDVGRVVYVGGSSLMQVVRRPMQALLPHASHETAEVFTAVVDGLARAAA